MLLYMNVDEVLVNGMRAARPDIAVQYLHDEESAMYHHNVSLLNFTIFLLLLLLFINIS